MTIFTKSTAPRDVRGQRLNSGNALRLGAVLLRLARQVDEVERVAVRIHQHRSLAGAFGFARFEVQPFAGEFFRDRVDVALPEDELRDRGSRKP